MSYTNMEESGAGGDRLASRERVGLKMAATGLRAPLGGGAERGSGCVLASRAAGSSSSPVINLCPTELPIFESLADLIKNLLAGNFGATAALTSSHMLHGTFGTSLRA